MCKSWIQKKTTNTVKDQIHNNRERKTLQKVILSSNTLPSKTYWESSKRCKIKVFNKETLSTNNKFINNTCLRLERKYLRIMLSTWCKIWSRQRLIRDLSESTHITHSKLLTLFQTISLSTKTSKEIMTQYMKVAIAQMTRKTNQILISKCLSRDFNNTGSKRIINIIEQLVKTLKSTICRKNSHLETTMFRKETEATVLEACLLKTHPNKINMHISTISLIKANQQKSRRAVK